MKRLLPVLLCLLLVVGCGASVEPEAVKVDLKSGVFEITPQEFVSRWNAALEDFKKQSADPKASSLLALPEMETGASVELSEGLSFELVTDGASGKVKEIWLKWDAAALKDEAGTMTLGFMIGALPGFLNPDSTLDLEKDLGVRLESSFSRNDVKDGDFRYNFMAVNGKSGIIIKPDQHTT